MFKSIEFERNLRLQSRKNQGIGEIENFSNWLKDWPDKKIKEIGFETLELIINFNYNHNVLNKKTYLAHVLRVTKMSLLAQPKMAKELIILSMIHNIFEATNMNEIELLNYFDNKTIERVKILKINREKQNFNSYLTTYYSTIKDAHISVSIVKIIDKIDNIFTLCLNPNLNKKKVYLKQIEDFVIPPTKLKLPNMQDYLIKLVKNAYVTKYISIESIS